MHLHPPLGGGQGWHKTRSKPQPPPEFQHTQELSSLDDSATLVEVKKTFGMLTTALVAIITLVDHLSQGKVSQAATLLCPPRCPPEYVTLTSAIPMTLTSGQQAGVT